jgi:hypothetical protein
MPQMRTLRWLAIAGVAAGGYIITAAAARGYALGYLAGLAAQPVPPAAGNVLRISSRHHRPAAATRD